MAEEESEPTPEKPRPPSGNAVQPRRAKPASLFIAQLLFTFNVAGFCFAGVTARSGNVAGAMCSFVLAVGLAYLTLAVQRREPWAHPASIAALAVVCAIAIARQFTPGLGGPLELSPADRRGAAIGGAVGCLSFVALVLRIALGRPAREYFLPPNG